jgi:hypothetical protein
MWYYQTIWETRRNLVPKANSGHENNLMLIDRTPKAGYAWYRVQTRLPLINLMTLMQPDCNLCATNEAIGIGDA